MIGRQFVAGLSAAALAAALVPAGGVFAHGNDIEDRDPGYGMRYDAMDEYCPGCGMMGGHGMGPGMMGGHGMGSGMMGGHGMGPGMMGGHGMGPGMMGGYGTGAGPASGLQLSSDQQKQMARIETELRKNNWALQGKIIDARGELLELYADETPDPKKIGAAYGKIFDLRRQMIEAAIEAQNRQRAILSEEQREKLRTVPYGGGYGGYPGGYGEMGHHQRHHMTAE